MRHRVTKHLIRIQAVCIWHFSCDWRVKKTEFDIGYIVIVTQDIFETLDKISLKHDKKWTAIFNALLKAK